MKTKFVIFFFFFSICYTCRAQVVSQFNWDSNPVLLSVVGPTAISAGNSATSSPGGVGGTNGLNPGAPTANDINLTIPNTSGVLDVNNIDISIDYRRNESTASMIQRGTFNFNTGTAAANFQVTFRVNNGSGGTTVTSTIYPIPQDATFRNYRFTYDNCTGIGTMYVNNTVVWSSPTPTANQNLYWVGDGNLVIGQAMDGANNNVPNLDNFILQAYTCATLPIELVDFSGSAYSGKNLLKWSTATEKNNDYFTLEKSENGELWTVVSRIIGAGNSSFLKKYQAYDLTPKNLLNYYRLQQTDFDGVVKKFSVIVIDNRTNDHAKLLKVTDMMGRDISDDIEGLQFLHYSDGTVIKKTNN